MNNNKHVPTWYQPKDTQCYPISFFLFRGIRHRGERLRGPQRRQQAHPADRPPRLPPRRQDHVKVSGHVGHGRQHLPNRRVRPHEDVQVHGDAGALRRVRHSHVPRALSGKPSAFVDGWDLPRSVGRPRVLPSNLRRIERTSPHFLFCSTPRSLPSLAYALF